MPTIRTYYPFSGYYPEIKTEFHLEANNNSGGEKTYELLINKDTKDGEEEILSLDMDKDELQELITMLQTLLMD